jgi:hypothetical protein
MKMLTMGRRLLKPKRRIDETGQAMLELALLLPILLLLVVGITDLGRAAALTIAVNNAATAGVEYGAQNSTTASDTNGMLNAANGDTSGNYLPGTMSFPTAPTHGCLCDSGTGVSCTYPVPAPSTCSNLLANCNGQPVECVQVVTQMNFSSMLNYPGIPGTYQANGHAVMRVRQ